jgi:excisionase family DNA binding protein
MTEHDPRPHGGEEGTQLLANLGARGVISIDEFAKLVGIGRTTAYDAARRGEIPVRRLGRRLFVPVPALLRWLGARPGTDSAGALASGPDEGLSGHGG